MTAKTPDRIGKITCSANLHMLCECVAVRVFTTSQRVEPFSRFDIRRLFSVSPRTVALGLILLHHTTRKKTIFFSNYHNNSQLKGGILNKIDQLKCCKPDSRPFHTPLLFPPFPPFSTSTTFPLHFHHFLTLLFAFYIPFLLLPFKLSLFMPLIADPQLSSFQSLTCPHFIHIHFYFYLLHLIIQSTIYPQFLSDLSSPISQTHPHTSQKHKINS